MTTKILVVEDDTKHLQDAKIFFQSLEGQVEVVYATSFNDAREQIRKYTVYTGECSKDDRRGISEYSLDGIITDIFMPASTRRPEDDRESEYAKRIIDYTTTNLVPAGIGIAAIANKAGIPFVICTAGYHHGVKYEWINGLSGALEWGDMADSSGDHFEDAASKQWSYAYELLTERMEKK